MTEETVEREKRTFHAASIGATKRGRAARDVIWTITGRKQAEEALRESEERYRHLVENINEAIYELDASGRVTYISPVVEEVAGYSPSEIVGRSATDFVHPDDVSRGAEGFQRAVSGHPTPNEYRLLTKTGNTLWVRSFGRPILEGDRIVGVRGVLTDITERKRAEEALRESEERYRDLAENLNDAIFEFNTSGRMTYANPGMEELSGYSASEMMGRSITGLIHPDDLAPVSDKVRKRPFGDREPSEYRLLIKSGGARWVHSLGLPLLDGDRVVGFRAVLTDITERKLAEEALRESEERFGQVAATAGEWISEIDAEGRFTYSSPAVKEILGYEPEEVIGKRFYDFYPAEEREQLLAGARRIGAAKKAYSQAIARNVHKDGRTVVVESSGLPILDAEGNVLGYRNVARDITERKAAEEALKEGAEAVRWLSDATSDIIMSVRVDGTILSVNAAVQRTLGYRAEDVVGKNVADLVHPEDVPAVRATAEERLQGSPDNSTVECRVRHSDGSWRIVESIGRISTDNKGEIVPVLSVRDITGRRRAENALRESEERWRSLVENAPDIIMTVSADSTILSINHTVPGFTVDSIIGTSLYDYVPREHHDTIRVAQERVFETAEPQSYEIAGAGPGGRTSWYFSRIGPIVRDGEVVAAVLITTDITKQKLAEDALRESEARLRAFANAVPDVAFILDENGLYVEVLAAPETKDLLYANGEALNGRRLHEVLPKRSADEFLSVVRKTIETQEPQTLEYVLDVRAGKRWFEGRTAPLSLPGENQMVVWVSHDITARKQAEAGRQKTREELDRKVERLAKRGNTYGLSFRELTVLDLVSTGKPNGEIATLLGIHPQTVSKHVENIREKMGASSRMEAGVRAVREGLLD